MFFYVLYTHIRLHSLISHYIHIGLELVQLTRVIILRLFNWFESFLHYFARDLPHVVFRCHALDDEIKAFLNTIGFLSHIGHFIPLPNRRNLWIRPCLTAELW